VAQQAADSLAAAGVVVGTVSTSAEAAPSEIRYPPAAQDQAELFAEALGTPGLLRATDVPQVTVALGADGLEPLLAALAQFSGVPPPACETPAG
jgi:hypothetical protein